MLHTVAAAREAPLDIGVWASDSAGAAFKASFIHHPDVVFVPDVDFCRAENCARFVHAFLADGHVQNFQMRVVVYLEPGVIEFVFNFAHFTALHALNSNPPSLIKPILRLMLPMMTFCFSFLLLPSTKSISSHMSPMTSGSVLKIIGLW